MGILGLIIQSFLRIEPKLDWIAFRLSGFGDDFQGFEAIQARIHNQIINNKNDNTTSFAKSETAILDSESDCFKSFDSVLKSNSYEDALISSILPTGVYFKSVDRGACSGILLVICIPADADSVIEITKESSGFKSKTTSFKISKGFKGYLLSFVNSEEFDTTTLLQNDSP